MAENTNNGSTRKDLVASGATPAIAQVKSVIGGKQNHRDTLRSLGLRRIGHTGTRKAGQVAVGMVNTVPHLVTVEEVNNA